MQSNIILASLGVVIFFEYKSEFNILLSFLLEHFLILLNQRYTKHEGTISRVPVLMSVLIG